MNNALQDFARKTIKDGLAKCAPDHQLFFKRMYSHKNLDAEINGVVDAIPPEQLDWAMQQVERTPKVNEPENKPT